MNSFVRRQMDSDILVVDDSAAIRKILTRVLRQTGMAIQTIHEAGDGQEAMCRDGAASNRPGPQRHQHAEDGRAAVVGVPEGIRHNGTTYRS